MSILGEKSMKALFLVLAMTLALGACSAGVGIHGSAGNGGSGGTHHSN
jgi:hypothetical protein